MPINLPRPGLKLNTNKDKKNQVQAVQAKPVSVNDTLIHNAFPCKSIFTLKIHHLWDKFYRINYHLKANGNKVLKSMFIEVDETNKENPIKQY